MGPERRPGTYVLLLELRDTARLRVGRLGEWEFPAGWYLYVGSAFGPGGVAARCAHHRRPSPRPHWHIDYLRARAELREIWFSHAAAPCEHQWAGLLARARGAARPVPRFGASDCDCPSHLLHFRNKPAWRALRRRVRMKLPAQAPLQCEIVR